MSIAPSVGETGGYWPDGEIPEGVELISVSIQSEVTLSEDSGRMVLTTISQYGKPEEITKEEK